MSTPALTQPCSNCCCDLYYDPFGGGDQTDTYDVTGKFINGHTICLKVTADSGTASSVRFIFKVDGSVYWDSGCLYSAIANTNLFVPAGTTQLQMVITAPCSSGDDNWYYIIGCEGDCP